MNINYNKNIMDINHTKPNIFSFIKIDAQRVSTVAHQVDAYIRLQFPYLLTKAKVFDSVGNKRRLEYDTTHGDWVVAYADWSLKKEKYDQKVNSLNPFMVVFIEDFTEKEPIEPPCYFIDPPNCHREHYMMILIGEATEFYSCGEKLQGEIFMSQAEYNQLLYWEDGVYKVKLEELAEE